MNSSAISDTDSYSFNLADTTNLSISLPAPESLTLTPSAEGVFGSKSIAVGVSTNSPYGYTLTMSAASSSLSRSAAVGGITPTIPTLESAVSEADFPSNYWGFKRTSTAVADTNYQPMLANHSVLVNNTSANADSSSSTITFGVKLSNETPSGDYSINIDFLAVTNVAPNLYYMQDATPSSLAAAMPNVHDTTVLYDRRDGQEYTIAKLKDGKYWMTKNLNLAGGTPLYSSDSDVPAGYDAEPYYTLPESSTTGFNDNGTSYYVFNSNNETLDCTIISAGCYSYYSFNAATAMSANNIASNNTDAPYSICPKNWKLPTTRTTAPNNSDFYQLAVAYGMSSADISQDTPNFYNQAGPGTTANFILSGNYYSSSFHSGDGEYWSSTTVSNQYMAAVMHFTNNNIYSYGRQERKTGSAVRCLFDATMQNFTSEDADAMALHQEEILVDARDGKNYYVTKLKDGNVWMTQNLDLDLTGPLDSTTTNLTVSGEAPYSTDYAQDSTTGIITWTPSATTISAPAINQSFTWSNNPNNPESVDLGDWYYRSDYYNNDDCGEYGCDFHTGNAGSQFSQTPGANGAHSHVGNYYNWSAAVASSNTSGYDSGNAVNSLCPANWNLPVNGMYGTLNSLYNPNITIGKELGSTAAADKALLTAPLYFVRAGRVWSPALHYAGHGGGYWSSTVYSSSYALSLGFRSSGVWPASSNVGRDNGRSLRCVLRVNQ